MRHDKLMDYENSVGSCVGGASLRQGSSAIRNCADAVSGTDLGVPGWNPVRHIGVRDSAAGASDA